jgi:hypothetical protein
MTKPPITATHKGMGAGIGNTYTRNLGVSTVSVPPRAKIAPEAPTTIAKSNLGSIKTESIKMAKSIKKILPTIPPKKYMTRKVRVPTSLTKKVPKKYRVIMLNNRCHMLLGSWTKRLVTIVQGC